MFINVFEYSGAKPFYNVASLTSHFELPCALNYTFLVFCLEVNNRYRKSLKGFVDSTFFIIPLKLAGRLQII